MVNPYYLLSHQAIKQSNRSKQYQELKRLQMENQELKRQLKVAEYDLETEENLHKEARKKARFQILELKEKMEEAEEEAAKTAKFRIDNVKLMADLENEKEKSKKTGAELAEKSAQLNAILDKLTKETPKDAPA